MSRALESELASGDADAVSSSAVSIYRNKDPMKQVGIFNLFVTADSDEEGAAVVRELVARGADPSASIFNTENLLKTYNDFHPEFVTAFRTRKSKYDDAKTRLDSVVREVEREMPQILRAPALDYIEGGQEMPEILRALYLARLQLKARADEMERAQEVAIACLSNLDDIIVGYTPLHIAAKSALFKTMKALVESGADVDAKALANPVLMRELHIKFLKGEFEDVLPEYIATPMTVACDIAQTEVIEWLLEHGGHMREIDASLYCMKVKKTIQPHEKLFLDLVSKIIEREVSADKLAAYKDALSFLVKSDPSILEEESVTVAIQRPGDEAMAEIFSPFCAMIAGAGAAHGGGAGIAGHVDHIGDVAAHGGGASDSLDGH
jgi:ankyrin repeat protein